MAEYNEMNPPIIAVVGPTATGKTALAIDLAEHYGMEIISCDSMQIYEGLETGTAKPTLEEMQRVPHHMIGCVPVEQTYSVSDYVRQANAVITDIEARGRAVLLVGGTGLYTRAVLKGIEFEDAGRDDRVRQALLVRVDQEGIAPLFAELSRMDPAAAQRIHPNNHKRVVRALEYCVVTGKPFSRQYQENAARPPVRRYFMLCLAYADRALLYRRIDQRVEQMLQNGLLAEAEQLYSRIGHMKPRPTAAQAIGYKELFRYFEGACSLTQAVDDIKRETRRYAKRQMTWFRREDQIAFLQVDGLEKQEVYKRAVAMLEGTAGDDR